MRFTAYDENRGIDLSGGTAVTVYQTGLSLGSNTPLVESGAGAVGNGPQASAWDHVHPAAAGASGSNSMTRTLGGQATVIALGNLGTTETINLGGGNYFTGTLNANCTIGFSNWPASGSLAEIGVRITEDGVGGFTPTFTGVTWIGGTTPTHVTTAASSTEYVFWSADGGTTIIGGQVGSGSVSGGTPALTLSTSNSAGVASTAILTDATIAVFDSTVPVTQAFGDVAATGSAGKAARRDHVHGMPSASASSSRILLSDSRATPFAFTDLLQMDDGSDFMYAD